MYGNQLRRIHITSYQYLFSWYVLQATLVTALDWKPRTHFIVSLNRGTESEAKDT